MVTIRWPRNRVMQLAGVVVGVVMPERRLGVVVQILPVEEGDSSLLDTFDNRHIKLVKQ